MFEAAAIGTPVAVWPVVAAQSPTARAFVRRGHVAAVWSGPRRSTRAAQAICALLDHPPMPSRLLDGLGAVRVARAIQQLAGTTGGAR